MIWEQPLVKEENLRFRTLYLYPVKQTKTHSVTSYILQCIVCFLLGCELSTGKFYNIGELKFVLSPGYRLRSERLLKKHIMEGLTLQIIGPRVRGFIILNKLRVTLGRFLMWENMVVSNLCQRNSALLSNVIQIIPTAGIVCWKLVIANSTVNLQSTHAAILISLFLQIKASASATSWHFPAAQRMYRFDKW